MKMDGFEAGLQRTVLLPAFRQGKAASLTFLTSRAREGYTNMHHLMGLVPPDQSALSLGRPLCVRRWSQGLQNQNWPLPTTPLANRREILGPRLRRLSSGARDALRLLGAYVGPTRGGGWVACAKRQRSLALPKA
jgi:hypothetical protein